MDERDLHALVDGQLEPERLAGVMDWLQTHPADAARVATWQAQRLQLRRAARALETDAELARVPPALSAVVRRHAAAARGRRQALQLSAAVALLAVGVLAGLVAGRAVPPGSAADALFARVLPGRSPARPAEGAPAFVRDAVAAHAVYAPERRHPVEVEAADEAHLVQWLGRRLGTPLKAPVLLDQGWRLLGGRLLSASVPPSAPAPPAAAAAVPRAQFMYEDAAGRRVTLYLSVFPPGAGVPSAFRSLRDGPHETFYWTDERLGYALSGALPAAELQALARAVHGQTSP